MGLFGGDGGGFGGLGQIFSQLGFGNFQSFLQPSFGLGNLGRYNPFSGGGPTDGQGQVAPQQQQPGFGQDLQQGQQQQQPFGSQNQQQQLFSPQNRQQPNNGGGGGGFDPNSQFGRSLPQIIDIFNPFNFNPSQGGGNIQNLIPDLSSIISLCGSGAFFFDQNPSYKRAVRELKADLLGISDSPTFAQTVSRLQNVQGLNRQVWLRASVGALLERPDISRFRIPSLLEVNPGFVLQTETVNSIQRQTQVPQQQRVRREIGRASCRERV